MLACIFHNLNGLLQTLFFFVDFSNFILDVGAGGLRGIIPALCTTLRRQSILQLLDLFKETAASFKYFLSEQLFKLNPDRLLIHWCQTVVRHFCF